LIDEPQVRLMNERGRLQRVIPPLASEIGCRTAVQLVVDYRHQPVSRGEVAVIPCTKQRRHVPGIHLASLFGVIVRVQIRPVKHLVAPSETT
jgi:hypothetical protein